MSVASVRALAEPSDSDMRAANRWSDLGKRVLSAAILAPLVLFCIWWGDVPYQFMLFIAAIWLILEWLALCGSQPFSGPGLAAIFSLGDVWLQGWHDRSGNGLWGILFGGALTALLAMRVRHGWALAAGVPYVGIGLIALMWLRADPVVGLRNMMFLLPLVWASDVGAYAAGRLIGGPKLAPRISPGKTWAGAVGGLAATIGAGLLVASVSGGPVQPVRVAAIAALIGIAAQAGDLLESLIKRHFGVKDSGNLIPGHGGLLDRVDALLIAAPVAALLALAAGRGVVLWQ